MMLFTLLILITKMSIMKFDNALQYAGPAIAGDCTGKPNGLYPDPTTCSCYLNW